MNWKKAKPLIDARWDAGVKCTGHGAGRKPCPLHNVELVDELGRPYESVSRSTGKRSFDAELAELRRRAERLKPIPVAPSSSNGQPKDVSVDAWGARRRGLSRQWTNANCLRCSIASLLGADIAKVPDPQVSYDAEDDWSDHYNARLAKIGCRLDFLPATMCPPRNPNALWICGLKEDDGTAHALVARGNYVYFDPANIHLGQLRMDRVTDGMILSPTRRVIPVFSPHGRHGYAVVAA
jgi:hypothetical protein